MHEQITKNSFFLSESLAFFLLGAGRSFGLPYHQIDGISLWPRIILFAMPALLAALYFIGHWTQREKPFAYSIVALCIIDTIAAAIAWNDLYRFAFHNAAALLEKCIVRGALNVLIVYILGKIHPFTAKSRTEKRYGLYCILSAVLIGSQSIFSFSLSLPLIFLGLALFFISTSLYKDKV